MVRVRACVRPARAAERDPPARPAAVAPPPPDPTGPGPRRTRPAEPTTPARPPEESRHLLPAWAGYEPRPTADLRSVPRFASEPQSGRSERPIGPVPVPSPRSEPVPVPGPEQCMVLQAQMSEFSKSCGY